eukprot:gene33656-38033_t
MDKNDFYGEVYGSHNLSAHLSHYGNKSKDARAWSEKTKDTAGVEFKGQYELENSFDDVYVAYFLDKVSDRKGKHNKLTGGRVWTKDRDFNIDTTSKVLFGSSSMVDLMIASGVGNYLEFKSFEGLYFMVEGGDDRIWKVPCS